ncbi:MAG: twin-arginine translocase subunit TatC, partial [Halodesulfurarchaeum sp.]
RDFVPDVQVATWKLVVIGVLAVSLSVFGVAYAYLFFFPLMFAFLAGNALGAGLAPMYSIVHWTEFIFLMALSFALAAQLPLVMSALSYMEIVPYESFRDKWKYAVVLIFTFGALFSPPDPFTQMMWAFPLLALYGFSLYLSKVVTTAKRGSQHLDLFRVLRQRANRIAGVAVLGSGVVYALFGAGGVTFINSSIMPRLPALIRPGPIPPIEEVLGLSRPVAMVIAMVLVAFVSGLLYALVTLYREIQAASGGRYGDPYIDEYGLDLSKVEGEAGIRAAPEEVFERIDEEAALSAASEAMDEGDPEKAEAILARFDAAQGEPEGDEEIVGVWEGEGAEPGARAAPPDEAPAAEGGETPEGSASDPITSTTAGMVDAFTEDETTEEDIGGYYHDIAFILDSLRSRAFRITAIFMLVMAGTFAFLYRGGIGAIRADFLSRIPRSIRPEPGATQWPITLHPVEALVFEVKISTVIGAVVTLPFLFYYMWPALEERGIITGDRDTVYLWGIAIIAGVLVGSAVGYLYVAPPIISWLVQDALAAGMTISYRVNNFFWMVFLTTAGIGLLADIPITMWLFHRGGIVTYRTMRRRWRVVVLGCFAFGALVTPDSLYTMLLIALPMSLFYGIGLALLFVVTLGGRRGPKGTTEAQAA